LTLAIIAGVPLGVLVGQGFGWRATFAISNDQSWVAAGFALAALLSVLLSGSRASGRG
jgi:predicted MFS family arabinose efflux permease